MVHNSSQALPSAATSTARVLTFGYDRMLVDLRSRVLRMAGYEVEEKFTLPEASATAQSDLIDAFVMCHTVPTEEREQLVQALRVTRKLMPILCIRSNQYDVMPSSCVAIENSPVAMVDAVRTSVRAYKSPTRIASPLQGDASTLTKNY
jgi:hypothetical protein